VVRGGASQDDARRTGDVRAAADDNASGGRDDTAAGLRPVARSAHIADLDRAPTVAPERLRVPSIGVDAPVVAVGVEDDGEMEVPADVGDAGWYRHGPSPGEPGAAVIAGHVDSREQGRGAFFDLRRLDVGARVEVTDADGNVQRFDVVARRTYDKAGLPADALFSRDGRPQLVLITCGGDFDREARSYRENVVVYAQPSAPAEGS
jgi:LPXTG-site transpeptidase (sortase) family protein